MCDTARETGGLETTPHYKMMSGQGTTRLTDLHCRTRGNILSNGTASAPRPFGLADTRDSVLHESITDSTVPRSITFLLRQNGGGILNHYRAFVASCGES